MRKMDRHRTRVMCLLLLVALVIPVSASPHHQDTSLHVADRGLEEHVSPDSSEGGRHQASSNNRLSTSKMDEDPIMTTPEAYGSVTESLPDDLDTPQLPKRVMSSTHKIDASEGSKKDQKKKVKPKKKDKSVESEEEGHDHSSVAVTEPSGNAETTDAPEVTRSDMEQPISDFETTNAPAMIRSDTEETPSDVGTTEPPITSTTEATTVSYPTDTTDRTPAQDTTTEVNLSTSSHESSPPTTPFVGDDTTVQETTQATTELPKSPPVPEDENPDALISGEADFSTSTPSDVSTSTLHPDVSSTVVTENVVVESTTPGVPFMHDDTTVGNEDEQGTTETTTMSETPPPVPPQTTTVDLANDDNEDRLGNDLESISVRRPTTTTEEPVDQDLFLSTTKGPSLTSTHRRQKQMVMTSNPEECPCGGKEWGAHGGCLGGRTTPDPTCPCREVCARQSGQSCSPGEPCDEEFGLHCNPQNDTCTGPLSVRILEVTDSSAKVTWGMSESELQPQALVSYTTAYRGAHTHWTKVLDIQPVITLENLLPNTDYYFKVEEDGKQEIATFRTKEGTTVSANMPKILVKQRSQTTLTVVWDDFRLPSYHSEYVLEYRPHVQNDEASEQRQSEWTKVQAGTQTIVTVSRLSPNTPYELKVAVWEDDKLELPSETITAYTADGCVRGDRTYDVNEEFHLECDFRCVCVGGNASDCGPRCSDPYVKIGSKTDDPLCYEKVLPSDPCCVTIRCTESKALDDMEGVVKKGECPEIMGGDGEAESCLSDCDHDNDCDGVLKCCPSSCGGAVCVRPLLPEADVCEHVYCGPNAECVSSKMACVCSEGYEGDPHDVLSGCVPVNATTTRAEEANDETTRTTSTTPAAPSEAFELDLRHHEDTEEKDAEGPGGDVSGNELRGEEEEHPTEAPFQLDLTPHHPGGDSNGTEADNNATALEGTDVDRPLFFDGCEYNNATYERNARFDDGCDSFCVCEGRGHVSCVPRCSPPLSSGGPACKEVPDPDDGCCRIMLCTFPGNGDAERPDALPLKIVSAEARNGTTVRIWVGTSTSGSGPVPTKVGRDAFEVWYRATDADDLSQWYRRPVSHDELTEVRQGVFELEVGGLEPQTDYYFKVGRDSRGAGLNMAEFSNTVNVKTFPAAVKSVADGCFHHNHSYTVGEVFDVGCEHRCVCRERGYVECRDRCALYVDAVGYEGCEWVTSEEDPCCTVPLCNNRRKKIPGLTPDGRPALMGPPPPGAPGSGGFCVVGGPASDSGSAANEVYRVGDIWESADGCRTKICRCTQLPNGTTSVQCQSECPPLPPNAHIPTARCPHPVLVKPDGPCKCPYVSCEEVPPRHPAMVVRPQCEFKGERHDMGREFYDGCLAVCHCGRDLRVECAAIECPYHFGSDFTECLEWDIDPDFFPVPPRCCAPAKCKNDGSCMFGGRKFQNFEDIPSDILPCGARCVCVNGNVTCENRCPPVEDVPPSHLPCPLNMAYRGHPEGETCCLQWMCKEPPVNVVGPHCVFQGSSRYLVGEKWEVQKGSQQKTCVCRLDAASGQPEVECRGGCPQIPQRFLLPTEQCLRPVIVTPEDPLMCSYVVCNNTISGQELYNVNLVALNSTAVRIRFSLSSILVGLIGHAELHFTADPALPPTQWHVQKFSRPKRLFDSPNIEYVLNALRPNTTYFLRVKIKIDALQQGGPESELFKLKMPPPPPEMTSSTTSSTTSTTTVPPVVSIDAEPEVHVIDDRTARISWKPLDPEKKPFVYALRLRYRRGGDGDWITTPPIHRDVTSYFLHDLQPLSDYVLDMVFTPPEDVPTKIMVSSQSLHFKTPSSKEEEDRSHQQEPEQYPLSVSLLENDVGPDHSSFLLSGIPDPLPKHVHVVKIMYRTPDASGDPKRPQSQYSFRVPESDRITLDHLEPGKRYVAQLELYLTDGRTLTSNEVEFKTKGVEKEADNTIGHDGAGVERKRSSAEQRRQEAGVAEAASSGVSDEDRAYFIALVVVGVVAAVAGLGFVLLLVILVRRQASAKAPISRTPSESAYDNPTYKTYDGERPEDKTNGQTIQTTQA